MTTTTVYTNYQAPKSRPILVSILAVLIGLYGFILFLLGLLVAVGSTVFSSFGGNTLFGYSGVLGGIIILVVGLIILGLAVGLWHLRLWALVLTLLFLAFEMVVYGLQHAFLTFGFIVSLLLFIYLLAVSRHFF
jgi:hypothetical protein